MNFTDFDVTPPRVVFAEVARLAHEAGVEVEESELIGLIPRKALAGTSAEELKLKDFDAQRILENRLQSCAAASGDKRW
jgi:glutamate formiminotransferase